MTRPAARAAPLPARSRRPQSTWRPLEWLLLTLLAWGVLTFGAVYPWAYWPLAVASGAVGAVALAWAPAGWAQRRRLLVPLMVLACAIAVQLVPLSPSTLNSISPATAVTVSQLDPGFGNGLVGRHALSIEPGATMTGLALYVAFALLMTGTMHLFSRTGPERVAWGLALTGAVVALIGIIQAPLYTGRIYGFWAPVFATATPYGPFVNKNHFAGWMLLCIPVTIGAFAGGMSRSFARVKPNWRDRILWLSTSEANRLVLLGGAALVMMLALLLSMSRSGISALLAALVVTGFFAMSARTSRLIKGVVVGFVAVTGITATAWVGADAIGARFAAADAKQYDLRKGAWADARSIAKLFPLTGTGLNTYATATVLYQRHDLVHHYEQAHNDYLQLAAEGGVLLIVPAFVCVIAVGRIIVRRFVTERGGQSYWMRAGAVTALLAIGLQSLVDFSLQMPGNAALFAVVCAIALYEAPPAPAHGTAGIRSRREQ